MQFASLITLGKRVFEWADGMQRRHGVLGFPYAVIKKYGDDDGGREAALITYYGFLSIFPLLLLGVALLSRVLTANPELLQRLIDEIVPPALRSTVEQSVTTLPTSTVPFIAGLIGLLFAGTGVVFSAYQTLNNVAAVPRRLRAGFFSRYVRVFVMLLTLLLGALAVGALTVAVTALPGLLGAERAVAALGSALIIFTVLLLGARLLLSRPAPLRAIWPSAALGAATVTVVLSFGPPLLARLVSRAGLGEPVTEHSDAAPHWLVERAVRQYVLRHLVDVLSPAEYPSAEIVMLQRVYDEMVTPTDSSDDKPPRRGGVGAQPWQPRGLGARQLGRRVEPRIGRRLRAV